MRQDCRWEGSAHAMARATLRDESGEGVVVFIVVLMLTAPAAVAASLDVCSLDIPNVCKIAAGGDAGQCRPSGQSKPAAAFADQLRNWRI
jgi:hypothetical protein